jgi:hypothetical protein
MVRVACTHPVNPPGVVQGGGVLCSRVALDRLTFWRIRVKVVYVGSGLDPGSDLDLHMSCGKETPAGPKRFESPLLLGEEDSILYPAS